MKFLIALLVTFIASISAKGAVIRFPQAVYGTANGEKYIQGHVELYHTGIWGTICNDLFDNNDARVLCRMGGYKSGVYNVNYEQRSAPKAYKLWLDDVQCVGNELDIGDCTHRGWGVTDCSHSEDVGIRCFGEKFDCGICHRNATCNKYKTNCKCDFGFVGNGTHCQDCAKCHRNATCDPLNYCTCEIGFVGNGKDCQEVTESSLVCGVDDIEYQGRQQDFPDWPHHMVRLGACSLDKNFHIRTGFKTCGLATRIEGHLITISGDLTGAKESGGITRRSPFTYRLECSFTRQSRIQNLSQKYPEVELKSIQFIFQVINKTGQAIPPDSGVNMGLGHVVRANVHGEKNLTDFGMRAYLRTCAVVDGNSTSYIRHVLLQDYCVNDTTVVVENEGDGQRLTFEGFKFLEMPHPTQLLLHCELVACKERRGCGVCGAARRRRSVVEPFKTGYVTRVIHEI